MNGCKSPEMIGIPIRVYMEAIGSKDDVFSPFNRIELKRPQTMRPENKDFEDRLRIFIMANTDIVRQLHEFHGERVQK